MELKELYKMQNNLDQTIVDRTTHGIMDVDNKRFLNDRIMALSVEVSEFANEVEAFKYWKDNKRNNKAKQLEEYVDILFFWLSIGNTMNFRVGEVEQAYLKKYAENIRRQEEGY